MMPGVRHRPDRVNGRAARWLTGGSRKPFEHGRQAAGHVNGRLLRTNSVEPEVRFPGLLGLRRLPAQRI
jgi:hypothetical protein